MDEYQYLGGGGGGGRPNYSSIVHHQGPYSEMRIAVNNSVNHQIQESILVQTFDSNPKTRAPHQTFIYLNRWGNPWVLETIGHAVLCRTKLINSGGGQRASKQRSHSRSPQRLGRVLLQPLTGAKKGWRSETSDYSESSEQFGSHTYNTSKWRQYRSTALGAIQCYELARSACRSRAVC